ncbi:hypothetical protein TNCV_3133281 [Trichonephila clavipes]|nr:hypothetical protein TNCV_3133281 [Trichonephila clavipes]
MTKKERKPKDKPESPKLRYERHHSFPPEKNKEKEKIFFARKSARKPATFKALTLTWNTDKNKREPSPVLRKLALDIKIRFLTLLSTSVNVSPFRDWK